MKALRASKYGKNFKKLLAIQDVETPSISGRQVLIEVHAAALNPVDYKIMAGVAKLIHKSKFPYTLGFDLAGKIVACGSEVSQFKIGDSVFSKVAWDEMGTIAEFAAVDYEMVSLKPENLNFEEAASLPLVAGTMYEALNFANVSAGQRVLICGGSGGTGSFAIQYAKYLGAEVIATCSKPNLKLVQELGADQVIDYSNTDFTKVVKEIDVVIDCVGTDYCPRSIPIIKEGGSIISIAWHYDDETLKQLGISKFLRRLNRLRMYRFNKKCQAKKINYKHVFSYPNGKKLALIANMIEEGHIKPVIDKVWDIEESIEALEYLKTQRAKGKVVIKVKN